MEATKCQLRGRQAGRRADQGILRPDHADTQAHPDVIVG